MATDPPPSAASFGDTKQDEFGECYKSPAAGLMDLGAAYNYWTGKITDSSLQLCLAIVAGNWAIHQSREALLDNSLSLLSLLFVLLALAVTLVGSLVMACLNRNQFYRAQADRAEWIASWKAAEKTPMEWPFTPRISLWGFVITILKVAMVTIAGIFLVVAATVAAKKEVGTPSKAESEINASVGQSTR